ncbi:MAG: efflux RND transporter periplasmic adaptor subunit [Candidatus Zixiibacteriota bacterium]
MKLSIKLRKILIPLLVLFAFLLGYMLKPTPQELSTGEQLASPLEAGETEPTIWTCSMHPQIRLPEPGQCPICFMDLVPVKGEALGEEHPRRLTMSEAAKELAEIQTAAVVRKRVAKTIRMVGKIDYDESRVFHLTSWVPGRIHRLYYNFTGVQVDRGAPMVYIYSPELLSSQEEYLQALKMREELRGSTDALSEEMAETTLESAEEKLRLAGISPVQIAEIRERGTTVDHMTIHSPIAGTVIRKEVSEGMYVNTGTRIYTIADLSLVWALLEAYESDLTWIQEGQQVQFTTEAYPGETFRGRVVFIDPFLNEKTRTVGIRLEVPNPEAKLKPGMFMRAQLEAPLPKAERRLPLVIPATAPLITGERAVVYVEVPETERPTYEGRVVELGPRGGDYYVVKSGLSEGEQVVVHGNFKIDSALQIQAQPSMMSPEGGGTPPVRQHGRTPTTPTKKVEEAKAEVLEVPDRFKTELDPVFSTYFTVQQGLSQDRLKDAQEGAKQAVNALDAVDMELLKGLAHTAWMGQYKALKKAAGEVAVAEDIAAARSGFASLSETLIATARKFGPSGKEAVLRFHCSMAFEGQGADWLQNKPETENPYFGKAMFKCGKLTETLSSGPGEEGEGEPQHE